MCHVLVALLLCFLHDVCNGIATFEKDLAFQGQICTPAPLNFGVVSSRINCAVQCDSHLDCVGFFHSTSSKSCLGVDFLVTPSTSCSPNATFRFYRKTGIPTTTTTTTTISTTPHTTTTTISTTPHTMTTTISTTPPSYGSVCVSSADCSLPSTGCLDGTCQCLPGLKLKTATSTCETTCTTYGSTFIKFTDYYLMVTSITEYHGVTASVCSSYCANLSTCRSFNYAHNMGPLCTLKGVTKFDSPGSWGPNIGIDHYVRNCA